MAWKMTIGMMATLTLAASTFAAPPDGDKGPFSLLNLNSLDALSGNLRAYVVHHLPTPLYDASPGWGNMKEVARGVEWHGKGLNVHPEIQRSYKNDGTWQKIHITADNIADTLILDVRDPQFPEPGRMTFRVFLSFDADVNYTRQEWHNGHKFYDGDVRARMRVKLAVDCEATARMEKNGTILPDAVLRLHVTRSDFGYDNLVVEHLGGIGGEAAKILGDAFHAGIKQWRPTLEREALAKVNEAIVKAGDTKEVRVNLTALITKKGKAVTGGGELLKGLLKKD
jgi:hypothetical protein